MAALTPLYRTHLLRCQPITFQAPASFTEDDMRAVQHGINAIRNEPYDKNDLSRGDLLAAMMSQVFGTLEMANKSGEGNTMMEALEIQSDVGLAEEVLKEIANTNDYGFTALARTYKAQNMLFQRI